MSVVLIRSDFWKKLIALVCVLSFTAMAQQGNTTLSVLPQAQSGTSATPALHSAISRAECGQCAGAAASA